jgi:hypothetical protein
VRLLHALHPSLEVRILGLELCKFGLLRLEPLEVGVDFVEGLLRVLEEVADEELILGEMESTFSLLVTLSLCSKSRMRELSSRISLSFDCFVSLTMELKSPTW